VCIHHKAFMEDWRVTFEYCAVIAVVGRPLGAIVLRR
jgi:hypothetical protein